MRKKSRQREQVLRAVREAEGHLTAEEVFVKVRKNLPHISLATVYRNLHLLSRQGKVWELQFKAEPIRYDRNVKRHAHFICEGCRSITDLPSPLSSRKRQAIEKAIGCTILKERLDFYGACPRCKPKNKKNKRRY